MKIIDKQTGTIHEVRKYVIDDNRSESVWCSTWYGRHVIGQDCEFLSWKRISEYDYSQTNLIKQYRDVIMKTVCGRVFRGYLDEHAQAWEFDGFDACFGRGSSYVMVRDEPVEYFKEMY